jgi:hypothetical protein
MESHQVSSLFRLIIGSWVLMLSLSYLRSKTGCNDHTMFTQTVHGIRNIYDECQSCMR